MADARLLEMILSPLSLHSLTTSNRPLRHGSVRRVKATVFCSNLDTDELDQSISGGTSKPVTRSSRGRTRQSLGLDEGKPSSLLPAQESLISEPLIFKEREGDANPFPSAAKKELDAATLLQSVKSKSYGQGQVSTSDSPDSEVKSLMDWAKRNRLPAESSQRPPTPDMANSKEFSKRIQDLINADLDKKYQSDDEDSDDEEPLFVDEDDPYWLDEPDEGWGYKVSELFKEDFGSKNRKKRNVEDNDDDVSDIPDVDWDFEQPERWTAKDVDSMSWAGTVFGDPSPLVVLLYDRYGKKGRECYHVLRELEDAANQIWECKRLPPRLVKINVSFEEDLASALRVKEVPTLLFVKGGKLIHQESRYHTADNLLRMISYFYHGAARPPCLKNYKAPENDSMKL